MRPSAAGDQLEVELIDKLRVANMLAKSAGLLDPEKEIDKPSVLNIEMVMPEDKKDKMIRKMNKFSFDFSSGHQLQNFCKTAALSVA